ncbi:MAG: hypothetical protein CBC55_06015 [Gammaproteobacteria bacterium TMED95]|nr:hypothetical protein [Gammaproteobacteria bacterium]OUV21449.1 MAG: hypothetical protein CBC55_06015 [Gammaproteobacteria bacterium TMED95]
MVEDRSKIAGLTGSLVAIHSAIDASKQERQDKRVKTIESTQEGQHMNSEIEPEASTGKGTH